MKEIVNRLHENRQIELAKSILESNGYFFTLVKGKVGPAVSVRNYLQNLSQLLDIEILSDGGTGYILSKDNQYLLAQSVLDGKVNYVSLDNNHVDIAIPGNQIANPPNSPLPVTALIIPFDLEFESLYKEEITAISNSFSKDLRQNGSLRLDKLRADGTIDKTTEKIICTKCNKVSRYIHVVFYK